MTLKFWGSHQYLKRVLIRQKRVIKNMVGSRPSGACRQLLMQLKSTKIWWDLGHLVLAVNFLYN